MATYRQSGVLYRATNLTYRGAMLQIAVPTADTTPGNWTTVPLFSKVNENPPNDGTFISSENNPQASSTKLKITSLTDPGIDTGTNIVSYRYQKSASASQQITLTVKLLQGNTAIAQQVHTNIPNGWTAGAFTLSTPETAAITDWTDLYVVFEATGN